LRHDSHEDSLTGQTPAAGRPCNAGSSTIAKAIQNAHIQDFGAANYQWTVRPRAKDVVSSTYCSKPALFRTTSDIQSVLFRTAQSLQQKTQGFRVRQIVRKIKFFSQTVHENDYMHFVVLSLFFLLAKCYAYCCRRNKVKANDKVGRFLRLRV